MSILLESMVGVRRRPLRKVEVARLKRLASERIEKIDEAVARLTVAKCDKVIIHLGTVEIEVK